MPVNCYTILSIFRKLLQSSFSLATRPRTYAVQKRCQRTEVGVFKPWMKYEPSLAKESETGDVELKSTIRLLFGIASIPTYDKKLYIEMSEKLSLRPSLEVAGASGKSSEPQPKQWASRAFSQRLNPAKVSFGYFRADNYNAYFQGCVFQAAVDRSDQNSTFL